MLHCDRQLAGLRILVFPVMLFMALNLPAQDFFAGSKLFGIGDVKFGSNKVTLDKDKKRNWLFTGDVEASYHYGMYHFQYNNFGLGYKGKQLVGGLRLVFSVGNPAFTNDLSWKTEENKPVSITRKDFRLNDATFMMSFGKRW